MRLVHSICLSLMAVLVTAGTAMASPVQEGGDSIRVYDFDDLTYNCGWLATTTGLYQDLAFPASPYLGVCPTANLTTGLQPSAISGGRLEVRVQLPGPATSVSVESYLYDYGEAPTLIAYDSTGVELARSSDGSMNVWVTLEVQAAETPIAEVGLLMPQLVSYIDNLTVAYGVPAAPEPEPLPEPEPEPEPEATDPVTIADCQEGGWFAFGFGNQGQCVSFVRSGRDSR